MNENTKNALIAFGICYVLTALTAWSENISMFFIIIDTAILMYYYRKLYNKMFDVVYFGSKGYILSLVFTFFLAMISVFILLAPVSFIYGLFGIYTHFSL